MEDKGMIYAQAGIIRWEGKIKSASTLGS